MDNLSVNNNAWEVYPEEGDIILYTAGTYMDKNIRIKGVYVPTKVSELENDSKYITEQEITITEF